MRNIFKITIWLLIPGFTIAQNPERKFISHKESGHKAEIVTSDGTYSILFYNPEIVETSFIPTSETFNPESHAVVMHPQTTAIKFTETPDGFQYASEGMTVKIKKAPLQISYFYKTKFLISEKSGYQKQ